MENYQIISELGSGIEGITYKALDIPNQREVAIKIVDINNLPKGINWKNIYQRESTALKSLSGSKFTPTYYDSFLVDNGFVIIMELIKGDSLESIYFDPSYDNNIEFKWILIGRLLEAYNYIYNKGYKHGDLGLHNLIWTGEHVVFVDFGNACDYFNEKCLGVGFDDDDYLKFILEQLIGSIDSWDNKRRQIVSSMLNGSTFNDFINSYNLNIIDV